MLSNQITQNRINWIDEYKGFVLLLVCIFHIEQAFSNIQLGMFHLNLLRMSAFFFISGFLFSTRKFTTFKSYTIHKTRTLLIPYINLSLLFLALDPVIYNFNLFEKAPKMMILNTFPIIHSTSEYIYWNLIKIFIAGKSSIASGPIWFVFTLYSISILFYAIQSITKIIISKLKFQNITILIFTFISFFLGWIFFKNHIRTPFGFERDFTCLGFFSLGYLCKNFIPKYSDKIRPLQALILGTIAFTLYFLFEDCNPNFSIMNNQLGKSFITFFACSVFGIIGLVSIFILSSFTIKNTHKSKIIHCCNFILVKFKGILRNISRNALIILAVHWWILLIIKLTCKDMFNKPFIAYLVFLIIIFGVILGIIVFRCKLYKLIGKQKESIFNSLSIK